MNTTLKTALFGATALSLTTVAHADVKPYIGGELNFINVSYKDNNDDFFADNFASITPYVGVALTENFALEAGYSHSNEKSKQTAASLSGTVGSAYTKISFKGVHLDALYKHALSEKTKVLGSLGIARMEAETDEAFYAPGVSVREKGSEKDTAFRFGAGIEHALTNQLNIRGTARYIAVDFDDSVDDIVQFGIGLNYTF